MEKESAVTPAKAGAQRLSTGPCHLSIEADADPLLPGRILARLTVRNVLPSQFSFRLDAGDTLRIDVTLADADVGVLRRLANQLTAIASVRAVTLVVDCRQRSLDPGACDED